MKIIVKSLEIKAPSLSLMDIGVLPSEWGISFLNIYLLTTNGYAVQSKKLYGTIFSG